MKEIEVTKAQHFVIVIGTSATDLHAFYALLDTMPSSENFSFIIFQHASPHYESLLHRLIKRHAEIQIIEAVHNMFIERGSAYVIPNDMLLSIQDGKLLLHEKKWDKTPDTILDDFSISFAEDEVLKKVGNAGPKQDAAAYIKGLETELAETRNKLQRAEERQRINAGLISPDNELQTKEPDNIAKELFNASANAIIVFKSERANNIIEDFRFVTSNKAAAHFLHPDKTHFVGATLKQVFPKLIKHGVFEKLTQVVEEDKPFYTALPFEKDGTPQWYEVAAAKMMDGLTITITNITAKKETDEKVRRNYHELIKVKENLKTVNAELEDKVQERTQALFESEERFRLIANAASDAIWDWNLVNNELWWSESFFTLFHFERNAAANNNAFRLQHIHPDDRARVAQSIQDAINGAFTHWSATYRFEKGNGQYAIITDKGSVVCDAFGTPYRMLGSMVDITAAETAAHEIKIRNSELHQLIQEFRFVTDFIPQMVWATQPDGYHDFYNKGWYDFTGLNYEQTKNEGWSLVLHPDDYKRTFELWNDSLQTGNLYEVEYRMRRHDGVFRWFLARALPMRNEEGNLVKWFGTCTDINDQKAANDVLEQKVIERTQELQKINHALEISNADLLQFASVASHDLKEPLRKIHIFSNLIKERHLQQVDGSAANYITRIMNASYRMTGLINDLLAFSHLSAVSFFEPTDINAILNNVLSDLELRIREKKALIEAGAFPEIDVVPVQINQVFQNIISNALKFSRSDVQPVITINCERVNACTLEAVQKEHGLFCRISIQDNGVGFDEQYSNKIFTIFQRLHSRERYEGTGIGLAITKKIIEKHNGLINAKSREGVGTIFTFILPLHQHQREMRDVIIEPVAIHSTD